MTKRTPEIDGARDDPRGRARPLETLDRLTGVVERITYRNPATGFCVLKLRAPDHPRRVTLVGHAARVAVGETVEAGGHWARHARHGAEFRAETLAARAASDPDGALACLGSGLVPGIGPAYARRLVDAFGEDVFAVIAAEPERLTGVPGIGPARARKIAESWREHRAARELTAFLAQHGVPASRAPRLLRLYGDEAIEIVRADPYRLARDAENFGFAAADGLAARLGLATDAPTRLRAGLDHVLAAALVDGHAGLPLADLVERTAELLTLTPAAVEAAVFAGARAKALHLDVLDGEEFVFGEEAHRAERTIVRRLRALRAGPPPWPRHDPAEAVRDAEREAGIALSAGQRAALALALRSKVAVVTGGPGVGKTLLVRALVAALAGRGVDVRLAAPTGRAAKRLAELAGVEARTIHRLLEFDPGTATFRRGAACPLACGLVVIDEASMIDLPLMAAVLEAVPDRAGLLLVGDVDQLPSIGPGQALADVIASGAVPVARIGEVFRQAAGSRIVQNAHRIRDGLAPDPAPAPGGDFYFVAASNPVRAAARVVELVAERIPRAFGVDPIEDVQVLCPVNHGPLGTIALNDALRAALNPRPPASLARAGRVFAVGDRVMQAVNDHDCQVYNGEVGRVTSADAADGTLRVAFAGREVAYAGDGLDRLIPAYATTVHKAQGSEFPTVVIPIDGLHAGVLTRNLLYTAVTRGRRLVVLVGDREALRRALERRTPRRWSLLRERLRAAARETAAPEGVSASAFPT